MQPTQGEDSTKREVKGGVWVNCDDRLPEVDKRVITRWTTTRGGPYIEIFSREDILKWESSGYYAPERIEDIEWLDESILPSQTDVEKEACEFSEWMAKDGYYPQKDEPLGTVWCKGFGKNMTISQTKYVYNQYLKTRQ